MTMDIARVFCYGKHIQTKEAEPHGKRPGNLTHRDDAEPFGRRSDQGGVYDCERIIYAVTIHHKKRVTQKAHKFNNFLQMEAVMDEKKQNVIQVIDRHMNDLSKEELLMVLKFIYSLKGFR